MLEQINHGTRCVAVVDAQILAANPQALRLSPLAFAHWVGELPEVTMQQPQHPDRIEGSVNLWHCKGVTILTQSLATLRELSLWNLPALKTLPENMQAGSSLTISKCPSLEEIRLQDVKHGRISIGKCKKLRSISGIFKAYSVTIKNCPDLTDALESIDVTEELPWPAARN